MITFLPDVVHYGVDNILKVIRYDVFHFKSINMCYNYRHEGHEDYELFDRIRSNIRHSFPEQIWKNPYEHGYPDWEGMKQTCTLCATTPDLQLSEDGRLVSRFGSCISHLYLYKTKCRDRGCIINGETLLTIPNIYCTTDEEEYLSWISRMINDWKEYYNESDNSYTPRESNLSFIL